MLALDFLASSIRSTRGSNMYSPCSPCLPVLLAADMFDNDDIGGRCALLLYDLM